MDFFRKKRTEEKAFSLSMLTWRKFKKEKMGMISLAFLCVVFIAAILGYLITPDKTPYCNDQHLEIALQPPGFSIYFLQTPKEPPVEKVGFFHKLLYGQPAQYNSIPFVETWHAASLLKKTFWLGTDR